METTENTKNTGDDLPESMSLDDFLELRKLGDLDLQAAVATLHAGAIVHKKRERVARLLARFATILLSEATNRGLVVEPPKAEPEILRPQLVQ